MSHIRMRENASYRTASLLLAILLAAFLYGCSLSCKHEKKTEATCTKDAVCSDCGAVLQEAKGHYWVRATQISPKYCQSCGIYEGTPLPPLSSNNAEAGEEKKARIKKLEEDLLTLLKSYTQGAISYKKFESDFLALTKETPTFISAEVSEISGIEIFFLLEEDNPEDELLEVLIAGLTYSLTGYYDESVLDSEKSNEVTEKFDNVIPKIREEDIINLSVDELIFAAEDNLEYAKKIYENKWIKLTGKVVSVIHNDVKHWTRTDYGKTTTWTTGEVQLTINGVTIKSGLIYWIAINKRFEHMDVVVEMDMGLCDVYYPQHSTITVLAYCEDISKEGIVFRSGRYPDK